MQTIKPWHSYTLWLATLYNFIWGASILFFPKAFFEFVQITPQKVLFWQALAVAVICSGIVYLLINQKLQKYWWVIGLAFLGKLVGASIAGIQIATGVLESAYIQQIFLNDFLWMIPFAVIAYENFKAYQDVFIKSNIAQPAKFPTILQDFQTHDGQNLSQLTQDSPTLLIFLRHFGCTFCREALADIAQLEDKLTSMGTQLVFVHMSDEQKANTFFAKYSLQRAHFISDPNCRLYEAMELKRANFQQVFGWKSWARGIQAGIIKKHAVGLLEGDGFRMPGAFLVYQNQILKSFKHRSAADIPDYQDLVSCPINHQTT